MVGWEVIIVGIDGWAHGANEKAFCTTMNAQPCCRAQAMCYIYDRTYLDDQIAALQR